MSRRSIAALTVVCLVVQDPAPVVAAANDPLSAIVDRCFLGGDAAAAAQLELGRRIEADYAAVFAGWQSETDARRKQCLEHALSLPQVRAASTIVQGTIARTETIQGGVVDYHDLLLHFAEPKVLRAAATEAETLTQNYVRVLRGSSRDWWLCDRLQEALDRERPRGARVWLFVPQEYTHRGPQQDERSMVLLAWRSLPAAAAPCLQQLLR